MKCFTPQLFHAVINQIDQTRRSICGCLWSREHWTLLLLSRRLRSSGKMLFAVSRERFLCNAECVPRQGRTDFKILFLLSRTQTTGIFQILLGFEIGLQHGEHSHA